MHENSRSLVFYLIHWVVSALALLLTSKIIPGIELNSFSSAMWAAVIIGIVNVFVWPLLMLLTLPLNILTLGLFTFVINGAVLKICSAVFSGFVVKGWWPAIIGSIVLSLLSVFLHAIFV